MIRLLLNHQEVDVYNTSIKYVAQSFLVGDIEKRQASFAPKIKIVRNAKSINALNNVGFSGHTSTAYNQIIRADLWENGILRITNGVFKLTDSLNLEGVIYTKEKTLFELIKNKKINEIDLSVIANTLSTYDPSVSVGNFTHLNIRANDFCFPVQEFISPIPESVSVTNPAGTCPEQNNGYILAGSNPNYEALEIPLVLYVKDIIRKIFRESGFEVIIPNTEHLNNEVINTKSVRLYPQCFSHNADAYHDIKQSDFLRSFLNRFGLVMIAREDDSFELVFVKDILQGNYGITDWSDKFSYTSSIKHHPSKQAQRNIVKANIKTRLVTYSNNNSDKVYKSVIPTIIGGYEINENHFTYQDEWLYNLDNDHLPNEQNTWRWIFENFSDEFTKSGTNYRMAFNPYFEVSYTGSGNTFTFTPIDAEQPIRLYNIEKVSSGHPRFRPLYFQGLSSSIAPNSYHILQQDKSIPKYYIDTYWQEWIAMLNNYEHFTVMLNLSREDVVNFNPKKIVHIKQLGGNFYVSKINSYSRSSLTKIELIKIK